MNGRVPREQYPWWVKFTLLGVPGRRGQWFFVWLSLASAIACIAYGALNAGRPLGILLLLIGGVGFPLAAVMYWLTIRWIDRHGTWNWTIATARQIGLSTTEFRGRRLGAS